MSECKMHASKLQVYRKRVWCVQVCNWSDCSLRNSSTIQFASIFAEVGLTWSQLQWGWAKRFVCASLFHLAERRSRFERRFSMGILLSSQLTRWARARRLKPIFTISFFSPVVYQTNCDLEQTETKKRQHKLRSRKSDDARCADCEVVNLACSVLLSFILLAATDNSRINRSIRGTLSSIPHPKQPNASQIKYIIEHYAHTTTHGAEWGYNVLQFRFW